MLPLLRRLTSPRLASIALPDKQRDMFTSKTPRIATMTDVVQEIFSHLVSPADIIAAMLVCKAWHPFARKRLYADVRIASKSGHERCHLLLVNEKERARLGKLIRGFTVTRSSAVLFDDLTTLAPNLRNLTLASTALVSSSRFTMTLPLFTSLTSLTLINQDFRAVGNPLSHAHGGTDGALIALASARDADGARGLTSLSIIGSPDLTSEGLAGYLSTGRCGSSLITLELAGCPGMLESSIDDIAEWTPNLRELTLRGQLPGTMCMGGEEISRASLANLARLCPMLNSLSLNKFPLMATKAGDASILKPFAELKHLVKVELTSLHFITADDLAHFGNVASLRIGHLTALSTIPPLPNVRSFTWTGSAVGALSLESLFLLCHRSPYLRRLVLDWTDHWPPFSSSPSHASWDAAHCASAECLPASFADYAQLAVFDSRVPSELVARALTEAKFLESVAVFGYGQGKRLGWRDVKTMERALPFLLHVD